MWGGVVSVTRARALLAEGTEESLGQASELLQTIRQQSEACCFTCQTIEVAVLQSLAFEKQGRTEEALEALKEIMSLAGPRGWVRPFVEAGLPMAALLKRLQKENVAVDHIEKILTASGGNKEVVSQETVEQSVPSPHRPLLRSIPSSSLVEPLTNRELDVLELLAQRLQNKEIAEKLSISSTTVKSHLQNIYNKMNVTNRRQAIAQAYTLGILIRR
jgi:LuxR family maltose regulon positive regulatory protein